MIERQGELQVLGELNPEQIEQVLRSEAISRLGCHARGRTYVPSPMPMTALTDYFGVNHE